MTPDELILDLNNRVARLEALVKHNHWAAIAVDIAIVAGLTFMVWFVYQGTR